MLLVAMDTILAGNYEFLSYQNVCIYKLAWRSVNTMCTPPYDALMESTAHQLSAEVWDICLASLCTEL